MTSKQHSRAKRVTTTSYRNRLRAVVTSVVRMDYELRSFDPGLYEMYSSSHFLRLHQDDQASHLQSIRLRALFTDWRRRLFSPADEQHDPRPKASNEPRASARLFYSAADDAIEAAVLSLTANFYHSIVPEAAALGVPAEGLLWVAMKHIDLSDKESSTADMLRLTAQARDLWTENNSLEFEEEDHLEAFVLKLIDVRVGQVFNNGWQDVTYDFLRIEYWMLTDFCCHAQMHGGHSSFGKAFACGLPSAPTPVSVEDFRYRVNEGVERFDRLVLETYIPF